MTVIDDEYPTYAIATAAEIVEELENWRDIEKEPQEVKYLTNTINSLAGVDVVQTVPDWVYWLDKIAMSYGSRALFNASLSIDNWE